METRLSLMPGWMKTSQLVVKVNVLYREDSEPFLGIQRCILLLQGESFLSLLKFCIKAAFESEVDFQVNFSCWFIFFRKQQELKSSMQT